MRITRGVVVLGAALAAACGGADTAEVARVAQATPAGSVFVVTTAQREALLEASGVAEPYAEATLSTKLMGTVLSVAVREGDRVGPGQVLVRIDARDLEAKAEQIVASRAEAEAAHAQALAHAQRMRALYAEEAAPKAQLEAAEAALASAEARVAAAGAGASELDAVRAYAVVRAPFAGVVTARFVDAGAFAAPGAPLVTVQDGSRLRVSATVAPDAARGVARGREIAATIEGVATTARVEGVVPAAGGSLYTINAIVDNRGGRFLPGGAATLGVPRGDRASIVIPAAAVVREGDLTGVRVQAEGGPELRWVRLGGVLADSVEVLSGLRDGERILIPAPLAGAR